VEYRDDRDFRDDRDYRDDRDDRDDVSLFMKILQLRDDMEFVGNMMDL